MDQNGSYTDILEMLKQLREEKKKADFIQPSLLPGIYLYMDQVTTFMDEHLKSTKRYEDDKILTKTMINNYAKNNLLPPPEKKKYSKDHLLLLTFIYYYKSFLSINDIQTLLKPVTEKYFKASGAVSLEDVYTNIIDEIKKQADIIIDDMENKFHMSEEAFAHMPSEDRDLLSLFGFMCSLSYDIYLKKQIVERIIDQMDAQAQTLKKEKEAKEHRDKKEAKEAKKQKNTRSES